jgi:hypothetical protein
MRLIFESGHHQEVSFYLAVYSNSVSDGFVCVICILLCIRPITSNLREKYSEDFLTGSHMVVLSAHQQDGNRHS